MLSLQFICQNRKILTLIRKYWIYLILVPLAIYSCQDCDDCGPSQNEPFVNLRFFNIDSLVKVRDTLAFLNDSLDRIEEAIGAGDTTLTEKKETIESGIDLFDQVENNILDGKIRIDEVFGDGGEGPLLFRDSLTNDSLTVFRFPLDMNRDESSFTIDFGEESNEISFSYIREIDQGGDFIVLRVYDVGVTGHSFDSVRLICNLDQCLSNETTFRIYF
jgi:hypothetical protein